MYLIAEIIALDEVKNIYSFLSPSLYLNATLALNLNLPELSLNLLS